MKEFNITKNDENQRLDKFLLKYMNTASKAFIYKMLRKKRIKLNNAKAEGNEILKDGDILKFYISDETISSFMEEKNIEKIKIHFDVIYEDENILVCFKPVGLLTHPESPDDKNTLSDEILYYLYENGEYTGSKESSFTPSVCNRLDRNTCGLVIAGKNLMASQEINKAIAENKTEKYYLTIVKGLTKREDTLTGYHTKKDNEATITENNRTGSKKVITKYKTLKQNDKYSLLEVNLITGRSHQIRAHLKSKGFFVIGDRKYGDNETNKFFYDKFKLKNQFLISYKLIWKQNEGGLSYLYNKSFTCEPPKELEPITDYLFK